MGGTRNQWLTGLFLTVMVFWGSSGRALGDSPEESSRRTD